MSEREDRPATGAAHVPVSAIKGEHPGPVSLWRAVLGFRMPLVGDVIMLLSFIGGCLIFYQRNYRTVFLSKFELGVDVVPLATQDAVIDGLTGLSTNIFRLWLAVTAILTLFFCFSLIVRFLDKKIRPRIEHRFQHGRWARWHQRVENDTLVRRAVIIAAVLVCVPILYLFLFVAIARPAQVAANNDAQALKTMVANGCAYCAAYQVEGREIRGWLIGGTPERLFVLEPTGAVVPLRLDDVEKIAPRTVRRVYE